MTLKSLIGVGIVVVVLTFDGAGAFGDHAPIITAPSIVVPSTTSTSRPPPPPSTGPPSAPQSTTTAPPETTTAPRATPPSAGSRPGPSASPTSLAVVTDPGDGLTIQGSDGRQSAAQVGQLLHAGDLLTTGQPATATGVGRPATINWLAGGMSQLYDAEPRIFVSGHRPASPAQTTAVIDAAPNPRVRLLGGFVRFWFPPGASSSYSFTALTQVVSATTAGTDFTIGYDPGALTSTIGVTKDTVKVLPTNPSLRPLTLAAGSEVDVTADRVGAITPLADQTALNGGRATHRGAHHATWLFGLVAALLLAGTTGVLATIAQRRRRGAGRSLPTIPLQLDPCLVTHPPSVRPTGATDTKLDPGSTRDEPLPVVTRETPSTSWYPTHRVPGHALPARAIPDGGAKDVALLEEGLEVLLIEERGEWANVAAASGWSGWVEAGRLERAGGEPRPAPR